MLNRVVKERSKTGGAPDRMRRLSLDTGSMRSFHAMSAVGLSIGGVEAAGEPGDAAEGGRRTSGAVDTRGRMSLSAAAGSGYLRSDPGARRTDGSPIGAPERTDSEEWDTIGDVKDLKFEQEFGVTGADGLERMSSTKAIQDAASGKLVLKILDNKEQLLLSGRISLEDAMLLSVREITTPGSFLKAGWLWKEGHRQMMGVGMVSWKRRYCVLFPADFARRNMLGPLLLYFEDEHSRVPKGVFPVFPASDPSHRGLTVGIPKNVAKRADAGHPFCFRVDLDEAMEGLAHYKYIFAAEAEVEVTEWRFALQQAADNSARASLRDYLGFNLSEMEKATRDAQGPARLEKSAAFSKEQMHLWHTWVQLDQMGHALKQESPQRNLQGARLLKTKEGAMLLDAMRHSCWWIASGGKRKQLESERSYEEYVKEGVESAALEGDRTQIERDLPRTFPDHQRFKRFADEGEVMDGELLLPLKHVLCALSARVDIGYTQGLNFLVGFLLIVFRGESRTAAASLAGTAAAEEAETRSFWVGACLLEGLLGHLYSASMQGATIENDVLAELVETRMPALHAHLQHLGVPIQLLSTAWFMRVYIGLCPASTAARILDAVFLSGPNSLIRTGMAALQLSESVLMAAADIEGLTVGTTNALKNMIDDHGLMSEAFLGHDDEIKRMERDISNIRRRITCLAEWRDGPAAQDSAGGSARSSQSSQDCVTVVTAGESVEFSVQSAAEARPKTITRTLEEVQDAASTLEELSSTSMASKQEMQQLKPGKLDPLDALLVVRRFVDDLATEGTTCISAEWTLLFSADFEAFHLEKQQTALASFRAKVGGGGAAVLGPMAHMLELAAKEEQMSTAEMSAASGNLSLE